MTDHPELREIITKAVCGRGDLNYHRSVDLEVPASHRDIQVLGNFVSNAVLEQAVITDTKKRGTAVQVRGHYDVHVWYACNQDTRAAKTTVTFIEYIPISMYGGESLGSLEAHVETVKKPRCLRAYVKNLDDKNVIRVEIAQVLAAEVVGLTKLKISMVPNHVASIKAIQGQELMPPAAYRHSASACLGYGLDMKCDDELPDEDEYGDTEYFRPFYDG